MRMLFVGDVAPYQTTEARRDSFEALGVPLETLDQRRFLGGQGPWGTRLAFWTLRTPPVYAFNRALLEAYRRCAPDVVWIEKGVYVFPRTLRALRRERRSLLVYHNTDDWRGNVRSVRFHWRYLLRVLDLYDVHVTSNLHNVREFREAGFPRVHHMELASNPRIVDPGPISDEDRRRLGAPVGFIGHWEPATERMILRLLREGIEMKVYGYTWEKAEASDALHGVVQHATVWGDEYARTALSFDINLGIVSAQNRSHTATRTFQVPALGAFQIHQRNELVTRYFEEGVEAEFFDSDDELVKKCRYYLEHPEERQRIAAAGQRRCRESGYSELDRVREVMPLLEQARGEIDQRAG
jgi:hypothetical protein